MKDDYFKSDYFRLVTLFEINISHTLYFDWSIHRKINERQRHIEKQKTIINMKKLFEQYMEHYLKINKKKNGNKYNNKNKHRHS